MGHHKNSTNERGHAMNETGLIPKREVNHEALDELRRESEGAQTWVRVSRDEMGFTIGGEDGELIQPLEGVIVNVRPCWGVR